MNLNYFHKYKPRADEETIILLCLNIAYHSQNHGEIIEIIKKNNIDWDKLIVLGNINRILPLLYFQLKEMPQELVPYKYLDYLKLHCVNNSKKNLLLTQELIKIFKLLKSHKVITIPFKGPILSLSLYKSFALREFSDLDLIVHKKDTKKLKELLKHEGYENVFEMSPSKEDAYLEYNRQLHLKNKQGIHLDIHISIGPNHYSKNFKLNCELWNRLEEITIFDEAIKNISSEDLLVILCIHGTKHLWSELRWIADIAWLVKKPDFNWNIAYKRAKDLKTEREFLLGMYLINFLLGINISQNILSGTDEKLKLIAENICKKLFNSLSRDYGLKEDFLFQFKLSNRLIQKLYLFMYLFRIGITPSYSDWKVLDLPNFLYSIYYFIRPFRLIFKFRPNVFKSRTFSGFLPTPIEIAEHLLNFSGASSNDIVYDLGCGDGRLIITAAKLFKAKGIGIDIDPVRIKEAKQNAKKENVEELTTFIQDDALNTDISNASLIVLYLPTEAIQKLESKLLNELKPKAKIISHSDSFFQNLTPEKTQVISDSKGNIHALYMWDIDEIRNKLNTKFSAEKEVVPI